VDMLRKRETSYRKTTSVRIDVIVVRLNYL